MKKLLLLSVSFVFLLYSCATYKTKYDTDAKNWSSQASAPLADSIAHTVYLVGDAGYKSYNSPALIAMKKQTDVADENTTIVFLGDNIYPGGMPRKDSLDARLEAERSIIAQMKIIEDSKGSGFFVNGNHDSWYYKTKGVKRQERFINKYLNRNVEDKDDEKEYFLPEDACPGPEVYEISKNLVIIAINSQWWLTNWDRDPDINYGCDVKTRAAFVFWFEEAVRKNRNKNIIIAMHHPLFSYGPHGGRFTLKEHIFPLTQLEDNFYLPLPVIGSIGAFVRSSVGLRQDIANPLYTEMKNALLSAASKNGNFVFASGHEHNMQYIEAEEQNFVVVGSGSKKSPVALGSKALFTSGGYGFAKIEYHHNGSAWISYFGASSDNTAGELLFRHQIRGPLPLLTGVEDEAVTANYEMKDAYMAKVSKRPIKKRGGIHKFLHGDNYRELYRQDFEFPALRLDTFANGVRPVKVGGGGQTNSLRLQHKDDKQYVMRSTTKDATRFIPYPFNNITPVRELVEESFLAAHPFAATAIPPLAEAANVYHTKPELYYIPKQEQLGRYNELFGDEVYLVEARPDDKEWTDASNFGNPDKVVGTDDVIENMRKNEKHQIDQNWVVRSRLFDHLIGDWDRHDDQWRWSVFKKEDDIKLYRPIPRDRDQAFCRYDGFVGAMSRATLPFLKQLAKYESDPPKVKWSTYNGRQFDKFFMNELSREEWLKEARYLQQNVTDEVIEEAFARWPEMNSKKDFTSKIKTALKSRRDNIVELANEYYDHLAEVVEITGKNDPDFFEVIRSEGQTIVRAWEMKKGEKKDLYYERTFFNEETKEIRIFGLEGADRFEVQGDAKKAIKIRFIGGEGKDIINEMSSVSGICKKTLIYDTPTKNVIDLGSEGKDMTSTSSWLNQYHRRDPHYEYDFLMALPVLGFNPDDGLFLGAQTMFTTYGFKKWPFSTQHTIGGQYAFATNAYNLYYKGLFKQVLGKWDVVLDAEAKADQFVENYFGYGNSTQPPDLDNFNFNRVRLSRYSFSPSIQKFFGAERGKFHIGLSGESVDPARTMGRITDEENDAVSGLTDQAFISRYFLGAFARIDYENTNHAFIPTRGMKFTTGVHWKYDLESENNNFANFWSELTFYQTFLRSQRITLASQLGWSLNTGTFREDFQFYQAVRLGGHGNLRGYRNHRFHGKSMFYQNTDLRIKVLSSDNNQLFNSSIGIIGGFDYGRVWGGPSFSESEKWHTGYGGGLWIAPLDFFILVAEYFVSSEDERMTLNIKYSF